MYRVRETRDRKGFYNSNEGFFEQYCESSATLPG